MNVPRALVGLWLVLTICWCILTILWMLILLNQ